MSDWYREEKREIEEILKQLLPRKDGDYIPVWLYGEDYRQDEKIEIVAAFLKDPPYFSGRVFDRKNGGERPLEPGDVECIIEQLDVIGDHINVVIAYGHWAFCRIFSRDAELIKHIEERTGGRREFKLSVIADLLGRFWGRWRLLHNEVFSPIEFYSSSNLSSSNMT